MHLGGSNSNWIRYELGKETVGAMGWAKADTGNPQVLEPQNKMLQGSLT